MIPDGEDWRRLTLKRDGVCATCAISLKAGSPALWSASRRIISCVIHADMGNLLDDQVTPEATAELPLEAGSSLSQGTAGGSAKAKYEHQVKQREKRVTARFPRAGKYILALTDEPQSTKAWKVGAEGEIAIGKLLDAYAIKYGFKVIHDRLIPKSRANIDHIAVTRAGIFVIDTKNYRGTIQIKDNSGFFSAPDPKLWVGGRNCMKLVDGMKRQTARVKEILNESSIEMPVIGVLAFYMADWETFGFMRKQEEVEGVLINSKRIEPIISREGPYLVGEIDEVARLLASALIAAT